MAREYGKRSYLSRRFYHNLLYRYRILFFTARCCLPIECSIERQNMPSFAPETSPTTAPSDLIPFGRLLIHPTVGGLAIVSPRGTTAEKGRSRRTVELPWEPHAIGLLSAYVALTQLLLMKKACNIFSQKPCDFWCLGRELNPHETMFRGILSPLRLPIPPPRQRVHAGNLYAF
jgi:hypothetical protein